MINQDGWSSEIFMLFFDIRGGIGGGGGDFDGNDSQLVDKWWIFIEFNISDDLIGTCWARIWLWLCKSGWKVIIRFVVLV